MLSDLEKRYTGSLRVQLVEGRDFQSCQSSWWRSDIREKASKGSKSKCNPYVVFHLGGHSVRSSTIVANNHPSWSREIFEIKVPKVSQTSLDTRGELVFDLFSEDSYAKKAAEAIGVTGSGGTLLGSGMIDFTDLMDGTTELLDRWITLSDGTAPAAGGKQDPDRRYDGEIRLILQYEPLGLEPQVGDEVRLEGYGHHPVGFMPHECVMHVMASNGQYILAEYPTSSGFMASVRLHRYCVYVSERITLFDRVSQTVWYPIQFALDTPLGKQVNQLVNPYVQVAISITAPAVLATTGTVKTTLRIASAAAHAILHV